MQDIELRLAALAKLVTAKSEAVEQRLGEEMARVEQVLLNGTDYDELVNSLKTVAVLTPKFHAAVLPLLTRFVKSVSYRTLTMDGEPIQESRLRYRSPAHLIREAIEATTPVRYLHTVALVDFLLELSGSSDIEVAGKAQRAFESLVEFDLNVFYGEHGLGAQPQLEIVARLAQLEDDTLVANADLVLSGLRRVLAASMEGHTWTYKAVTISRGSVTSEWGVAPLRAATITLLKRMYWLDESIRFRKNVLSTLDEAMHREQPVVDEPTVAMFERDAAEVLLFMEGLVANEALPLVQSIEHHAYWNYFHAATPTIAAAALKIREALEQHAEYQIYKQLIGFEGIFGQWEELRRSEAAWEYTDKKRLEFARKFIAEIDDSNEPEWCSRILKFSETRSDDLATFPVYYEFLELLGQRRPQLALRLLTEHDETMGPFQIALMAGLWIGPKSDEVAAIANRWIAAGTNLIAVAKSLIKGGERRLDTLSSVICKGAALDNHDVIVHAMGTAARLYGEGVVAAKGIFMQGLRELAKRLDAGWARAVWFNRDFKTLIASMDADERAEVLRSLASLTRLDYQAEEVLAAVCAYDSASVLDFLVNRLKEEAAEHSHRREFGVFEEGAFEAIPRQLHQLKKLLAKEPRALVYVLRNEFDDEARSMFPYRGAGRLLEAVFPNFADPLAALLQELVIKADPKDIDFAMSVLRVFGGGAPILETAKFIVKAVPEKSPTWNELAAALETTGVLMGEYGMAEAFERKREEMLIWSSDEDPRVRAFAAWLIESFDQFINRERQRAHEDIELRKYRYGTGKEET
ncbi:MAG: hypothetical protein WA071_08360 [Undibacterium umbellatum]|uniref:hypothetical protein n=1 Tax=Undibacterium umbellatum TaxID=2762300 RepID=UPI003BB57996